MFTPIIDYDKVWVKREDLCFSPPAPPFSKCRGILSHFKTLKEQGIETVGYVDTTISMAGWGVSWACREVGMKAVIFGPTYKKKPSTYETLVQHWRRWEEMGAEIIPIQATRTGVNWYIGRRILKEKYGEKALLLPLGLPFAETIEETEKEFVKTIRSLPTPPKTIVLCIGSGTICSGIWRGMNQLEMRDTKLYGITCHNAILAEEKIKRIEEKSGVKTNGLFKSPISFQVILSVYNYTSRPKENAPFPCNPYYDLKAWEWLMQNRSQLEEPILFWNIGQ